MTNKNNNTLIILLAIVVGVAIGLGAYFIYDNHQQKAAELAAENARRDSLAAVEKARLDSIKQLEAERARRLAEEEAHRKLIETMRSDYESILRKATAEVQEFGWSYYFMFDFNRDSLPELCVMTATSKIDGELDIYGVRNGSVKHLFNGGAENSEFYDNGTYILRDLVYSGGQFQQKIYGDGDDVKAVKVYERTIPVGNMDDVEFRSPSGTAVTTSETNNYSLLRRSIR